MIVWCGKCGTNTVDFHQNARDAMHHTFERPYCLPCCRQLFMTWPTFPGVAVQAVNTSIALLAEIVGVDAIPQFLVDLNGTPHHRGLTRHGYQCTTPTCLNDVGHPDHHEDQWGRSWRTYGDGPTCPHGINGGVTCWDCEATNDVD